MGWGLIYQHLSWVGPNILASPWGGPSILASQWGGTNYIGI